MSARNQSCPPRPCPSLGINRSPKVRSWSQAVVKNLDADDPEDASRTCVTWPVLILGNNRHEPLWRKAPDKYDRLKASLFRAPASWELSGCDANRKNKGK